MRLGVFFFCLGFFSGLEFGDVVRAWVEIFVGFGGGGGVVVGLVFGLGLLVCFLFAGMGLGV